MSNSDETPGDKFDRTRDLIKFEQALTLAAENYPPMWRRLYQNLIREGFTQQEAMRLLEIQILSAGGARI